MKIPPYAAYVLPKCDGWNVGIMPYRNKIIPPVNPIRIPFFSLSHCHTKYPPPISQSPASRKKKRVIRIFLLMNLTHLLFLP